MKRTGGPYAMEDHTAPSFASDSLYAAPVPCTAVVAAPQTVLALPRDATVRSSRSTGNSASWTGDIIAWLPERASAPGADNAGSLPRSGLEGQEWMSL